MLRVRHGVVRGARSGGARRALSLREHKARDAGSHIDLQEIDSLIYRAEQSIPWVPPGGRGVFRGQVIGQALHSATRTVEGAIGPHGVRTMAPHSLHAYFLQAGDPTHPITYRVRRTSDRRSYVSRSVDAVQRGEIIFKMQASFARAGETGLEHYAPMPDVPPPDELPSVRELLEDVLPRLPDAAAAHLRKLLTVPIEMKFVGDYLSPLDPNPPKLPARQQIWIRAYEPIREAERLDESAAAYFSDHNLLACALRPHGIPFPSPKLGVFVSLDHSMWFHAPFRCDEWLLYDMDSPALRSGRGLSFGHLYRGDTRELVMSCAQQGVVRQARPSPKRKAAQYWLHGRAFLEQLGIA